jgi:DNA-binding NtrC family response regulator
VAAPTAVKPVAAKVVRETRGVPTREELESLLADAGGVVSEVAARTGRSRKQVYRWLEQYAMDVTRYR